MPDIQQTAFGETSFAENPENRCPCVLLLDISSSMSGPAIQELQRGVEQYRDELLDDPLARKRVEVAIITFGGTVQTPQTFATADTFFVPLLQANGNTPMSGALIEAYRLLEGRKAEYKSHGITYYRPWIFLITDGEPTDDTRLWQQAVQKAREVSDAKGATLFVIGVKGANTAKLSELPAANGVLSLDGVRFKDLFAWLSQSQKGIARSRPGDELALPPATWVITT